MLYLTHTHGGRIDATYSGRFSFVGSIKGVPIEEVFCKGNIDYPDLNEEFNHYRIFRICPTGLSILSLRWFARFLYSLNTYKDFVKHYYLLRSIYFDTIYDCHEAIVANQISYKEVISVLAKDWKAFLLMAKSGLNPVLLFLLIFFPFHVMFGLLHNYHFAHIGCINGKHRNVSFRSYLNDKKSRLNKLTQLVWVEKIFKGNRDDIEWTRLKFSSERKYYELNGRPEDFKEYIGNIVLFVSEWTGKEFSDSEYINTCSMLYSAPDVKTFSGFLSKSITDKSFWNFFYMQGN
jgi:hypothetical protein